MTAAETMLLPSLKVTAFGFKLNTFDPHLGGVSRFSSGLALSVKFY